jgi:ATP-dependent Clp endopeptidase proteolytic subunit ClpP
MKLSYRTQKNAQIVATIWDKPLDKPDWYKIVNSGDEGDPEILIYDYIGWPYNDPRDLIESLAGMSPKSVTIRINSPGGDVFDAMAIFNAMESYKGKIITRIESLAASAASIIALAGKEIQAYKNSMYMIHNPWMVALGDQNELRDSANLLEKIAANMIDIYTASSKQGKKKVKTMLDDETWMTAKEAQDLGFVKTIVTGKSVKAEFKYDVFDNVPPSLIIGSDPEKDQELAAKALLDAGFPADTVKDIVAKGLSKDQELREVGALATKITQILGA